MNRIGQVSKMLQINPLAVHGPGWAVVVASLLINIAIYASVHSNDGTPTTGGLASVYVVSAIVYATYMTQIFPFALGMSVSRRSFYATTLLTLLATAAGYALVLLGLRYLETGTRGWGVDLHFFRVPFLVESNPFLQWAVYAVPFVLLGLIGMSFGTVLKRWGQPGMWVTMIGATVALGGSAVLISWLDGWGAVGGWFADQTPVSLFVGWPLAVCVPLAAAGFLILRRTRA